jgi:hypothetical protein
VDAATRREYDERLAEDLAEAAERDLDPGVGEREQRQRDPGRDRQHRALETGER